MKDKGWVKLFRAIKDWEWYDDANVFRVFIHCILSANIEDKSWRNIVIKRGDFLTSVEKISKELKLTIQQTRTALKKLKSTDCVTIKTTSRYTMITIVAFDKYQALNKPNNKQITNKISNNNKRVTNKQQTNNKQITTTKELKNIRSKEYKKKEEREEGPGKFDLPKEILFRKFKKIWEKSFPDYQFQDDDHFHLEKIIRYFRNVWKKQKKEEGFPTPPKMDETWACDGWQVIIDTADDFNKTTQLNLSWWAKTMNAIYSKAKNSKNERTSDFRKQTEAALRQEFIPDF